MKPEHAMLVQQLLTANQIDGRHAKLVAELFTETQGIIDAENENDADKPADD